ncbi:MAG TPA: hemolysin family protein [Rhodothermales bacterium]|nr:hemolysin family protein [Rhodothermales bacterium]HRR09098.1 hemolysin family protein [Rhodothermales bacterium]
MLFLIAVILLLLLAFFAAAESAFVTANRYKAEIECASRGQNGKAVEVFLHNPIRLFTTTLVGTVLGLVLYATALAFLLSEVLRPLQWSSALLLPIQILFGFLTVLLLGEILPKHLVQKQPNEWIFLLARPLMWSYWFLFPIIQPTVWLSQAIAHVLRIQDRIVSPYLIPDLESLLSERFNETPEPDPKIDEDERELVSNVLELRETRVREVMVSRTQITALRIDTPLSDVRRVFTETGYSKIPVYVQHLDNMVGYVLVHDLFHHPATLENIVRPIKFVPEAQPTNKLLQALLKEKTSIALVVDEHGGVSGLVTMEDLLEELIGEIEDEFDPDNTPVRVIGPNTWSVRGDAEIHVLREQYGFTIPEGNYDTMGGYILHKTGKVPEVHGHYIFDQYAVTILKATPKRVDLVKLNHIS